MVQQVMQQIIMVARFVMGTAYPLCGRWVKCLGKSTSVKLHMSAVYLGRMQQDRFAFRLKVLRYSKNVLFQNIETKMALPETMSGVALIGIGGP